jgi:hypothetical protein
VWKQCTALTSVQCPKCTLGGEGVCHGGKAALGDVVEGNETTACLMGPNARVPEAETFHVVEGVEAKNNMPPKSERRARGRPPPKKTCAFMASVLTLTAENGAVRPILICLMNGHAGFGAKPTFDTIHCITTAMQSHP